jgi:hypothetical protein
MKNSKGKTIQKIEEILSEHNTRLAEDLDYMAEHPRAHSKYDDTICIKKLLALVLSSRGEVLGEALKQRVVDLGIFAGVLDALVKWGRKSESNLEKTRDLYKKKYEAELAKLNSGKADWITAKGTNKDDEKYTDQSDLIDREGNNGTK